MSAISNCEATNGEAPEGALLQGASGLLYGTTSIGGANNCPGASSCGTIFSLDVGIVLSPVQFVPVKPCRVLDTRQVGNGQPFVGELTVDVVGSICAPPSTAQAYVLNATVVPSGPLGYLTLWPDGGQLPVVSTLNSTDGAITSNMAIVPTNNGKIDAFASNLTQLIIDITSYFAP